MTEPTMSPAQEFADALIAGFIAAGVQHVVVAPGSRSQALALAAVEAQRAGTVCVHVRIDERGAGFFALGLAVESRIPAVVIVTSGTAVANLHPAVLEAHHPGVPLIVLSADRTAHFLDISSNKTKQETSRGWSIGRAAGRGPADTRRCGARGNRSRGIRGRCGRCGPRSGRGADSVPHTRAGAGACQCAAWSSAVGGPGA